MSTPTLQTIACPARQACCAWTRRTPRGGVACGVSLTRSCVIRLTVCALAGGACSRAPQMSPFGQKGALPDTDSHYVVCSEVCFLLCSCHCPKVALVQELSLWPGLMCASCCRRVALAMQHMAIVVIATSKANEAVAPLIYVLQCRHDYIPATFPYSFGDCLRDLLDTAARLLVPGGRLVFWMPDFNGMPPAAIHPDAAADSRSGSSIANVVGAPAKDPVARGASHTVAMAHCDANGSCESAPDAHRISTSTASCSCTPAANGAVEPDAGHAPATCGECYRRSGMDMSADHNWHSQAGSPCASTLPAAPDTMVDVVHQQGVCAEDTADQDAKCSIERDPSLLAGGMRLPGHPCLRVLSNIEQVRSPSL